MGQVSSFLPWLTFVAALLAVAIAVATFIRAGGWRAREEIEGQQNKTEIKINQVDQQARDGVERLEETTKKDFATVYQDMHSADGEVRNMLNRIESEMRNNLREHGMEISQLKENVRHLPTQSDLAGLREDVGELKASNAALTARMAGVVDLLSRMDRTLMRLEDHAIGGKS